jgi:hypothetical protein
MEKLFKNLIAGNTVNPPKHVLKTIYREFENPINIEWYVKNEIYEAIFYENNKEHIAKINDGGNLVDYRINLPAESLPGDIKKLVQLKGEIMNVVSIHNKKNISYEIIIRDSKLNRYIIFVNQKGIITEEKLL